MDDHTKRRLAFGALGVALAISLALPSAQPRNTDAAPGVSQVATQ